MLQGARDLRWPEPGRMLLAASREAVVEVDPRRPGEYQYVVKPDDELWQKTFAFAIGGKPESLLVGSRAHEVRWRNTADGKMGTISSDSGLELIMDVDRSGDNVLVLAGRRSKNGEYLEDGAWGFRGKIVGEQLGLQPFYVSPEGLGAPSFNNCVVLDLPRVRFLQDGRFIFVPGVDPDIYLYDPAGQLLKRWSTAELGISFGCDIPEDQKDAVSRDPTARWSWLNRRRLVDEIVELPSGVALILREQSEGRTQWTVTKLPLDGRPIEKPQPLKIDSQFNQSRVAADRNGVQLGVLEYFLDREDSRPRRIHLFQIPEAWLH